MKCPKCHYLSFEPEARCRHCGYDFSLSDSDLSILPVEDPEVSLEEIELRAERVMRAATTPASLGLIRPAEDARISSAVALEDAPSRPSFFSRDRMTTQIPPTTELPLFVKVLPDPPANDEPVIDEPLERMAVPLHQEPEPEPIVVEEPEVQVPAAPRPLAVRRPAPDTGRQRTAEPPVPGKRLGPFDRDLLEDLERIEAEEAARVARIAEAVESMTASTSAATITRMTSRSSPRTTGGAGSVISRFVAASIDFLLLGGINAAVLWFTLRQVDLPFAKATDLPIVPFVLFLLILDVGYLLMFTAAGGQTIGKMAAGLKVVQDDGVSDGLTVQQAAYRSVLVIPSVLALGLGFLPALIGRKRSVHDRLSHTRVVRV
jgi:uncharacterized RDD family membrane protein YckC